MLHMCFFLALALGTNKNYKTFAWLNVVIIYTVLWSLAAGDTSPFKQHLGSEITKSRKDAYKLRKVLPSIQRSYHSICYNSDKAVKSLSRNCRGVSFSYL